ncbi:hypothetical protein BDZ90DRAFT_58602 [Jaminaea rosea]|uniref:Secreted protein n=1 Tax=Jaminaea rosea TaxID=1569628 RepID=A0A316ULH6_9BASI|nr:hypothetical protein BDZ90DRAFT_58602 [Jaminaea rosea]PWN26090.1 hypothetical protein BDZ90DRAFT_58602 [Jaminaea rosea]
MSLTNIKHAFAISAMAYILVAFLWLTNTANAELLGDCYSTKACNIKKLSGHGVYGDYSSGSKVYFNQTNCYAYKAYIGKPYYPQKIRVCERVNFGECADCSEVLTIGQCYVPTVIYTGICVD